MLSENGLCARSMDLENDLDVNRRICITVRVSSVYSATIETHNTLQLCITYIDLYLDVQSFKQVQCPRCLKVLSRPDALERHLNMQTPCVQISVQS